jgi:hypothetical protein
VQVLAGDASLTDAYIRRWFVEGGGFEEVAFEVDRSERYAVGVEQLLSSPESLREGERLFNFVGFWDNELDGER